MTRWALRIVLVLVGLLLATTARAKKDAEVVGAWSPVVQGIRGRLIATPTRGVKGKAQLALSMEVENMGETPVDIIWGDLGEMVHLSVDDDKGAPVPPGHPGGNSLQGAPVRKTLLPKKTQRVVLSKGIYEHLALDRVMLRPFVFQGWFLTGNQLHLSIRGEFTAPASPNPAHPTWHDKLALPGVAIVTP